MTSHCANPACGAPVGVLREGRLFQFEVKPQRGVEEPPDAVQRSSTVHAMARRVAHFWLCGRCSSSFTLVFDAFKGIVVRQRKP